MASDELTSTVAYKVVLVSFLERTRTVRFLGVLEELFYATKETFADVLQEEDPWMFFQLRDEN